MDESTPWFQTKKRAVVKTVVNEEKIGSVPKYLKKGSAACRWKRLD